MTFLYLYVNSACPIIMLFVLITDATRKTLLPGVIPTLNLPPKSFETETKL